MRKGRKLRPTHSEPQMPTPKESGLSFEETLKSPDSYEFFRNKKVPLGQECVLYGLGALRHKEMMGGKGA